MHRNSRPLTDRIIFHVDVNSAFLSWSALKKLEDEPGSVDLRTIPSAVGGDIRTRHGVITARSIPAKAYKVQTGEPVVRALEKCPQLVLVRSDFPVYKKYSGQFVAILREFTDQVQQVSIDEAFLDVTALKDTWGTLNDDPFPIGLAARIKDTIRDRLGFTVNVGISVNRFLAKMASDFEKPDKIHTLFPEEIPDKLWPLPIRDLYGCGQATAGRLNAMGFYTIGEVAALDVFLLQSLLGDKAGTYLHERANGRDDSPVNTQREDARSYSNELTTTVDIDSSNFETEGISILKKLSQKVAARLQRDRVRGYTVVVIVKTGSFRRHTRQTRLQKSVNDADTIFRESRRLLGELVLPADGLFANGEVLRLIGIGVSGLDRGTYHQMDLSEWAAADGKRREKKERLEQMMNKVQARYGNALVKGADHLGGE